MIYNYGCNIGSTWTDIIARVNDILYLSHLDIL